MGFGLIGGSIGLALRFNPRWRVTGYDVMEGVRERALSAGACAAWGDSVEDVASSSDILVLAAPSGRIPSLALAAGSVMQPGAVITDVGSVKAPFHHGVDGRLPRGVRYVGGHPMAGSERFGFTAASPDLFRGAVWALTAGPSDRDALPVVEEMVRATGATPLLVDAAEHDRAVAYTSHLPYLAAISIALASMEAARAIEPLDHLRASGFASATRLARSDPSVSMDYCWLNRFELTTALDSFAAWLGRLRSALEGGEIDDLVHLARRAREYAAASALERGHPNG